MGLFNSAPATPEQLYRKSLRDQFLSERDLRDAWRTAETSMILAAREESATRARDMELKAIERAKAAKQKRDDELKRS
ncbi:MAG: hypothetical protein COX38_01545 [Candidatus Nealsonbacteria bacterium CG23_combo_of_CG06-09_8_20_14_all_39_25]|uniref:Uncharacterized protein n=1 Tax=Candidatus Nealsonbacteria bacterium CG23_combo_of_CG06-09_8_20_14_all_39_25 TaxID=1974723 RepID=A0A2G9YSQ2_9BACT|nr:MAG: hypothetical protein COX38_01545 [Candidatus Nealsonbacteria bacterium CG23_combo_of_CG06-09_8_20_14_all_39_25]